MKSATDVGYKYRFAQTMRMLCQIKNPCSVDCDCVHGASNLQLDSYKILLRVSDSLGQLIERPI